ncbi:ABC transporter ATP-binding protein [Paenibacillaceae bacterium WGS1546]|uniref:ABC transporter ATP-binding protein n=1 Tax=Cohnella sp. WGS1546 TaxID=3366810 RepID=UPI00372D1EEC
MSKKPKKPAKSKRPSPVKKLMPYLRRRKAPMLGSMLLSVLASALGLVPYVVVYLLCIHLVDRTGDAGVYWQLALAALAAVVAKGVFLMLSANLAHQAAYDVIYEVRLDLADKLTKLPLGYFDRHDIGSIKHTMNEDAEQLEEGVAHLIPDLSSAIAIPALTFILMLALDWRLALASFAFIPILSAAFSYANSKIKPLGPLFAEFNALVSSALLRYVYGMKVIRAFSRSESAYAEYSRIILQSAELGERTEAQSVAGKSLAAGLSQMPLLVVVPIGIALYAAGQITLPLFILFILLTIGIGNTLLKTFRTSGQISFRLAGVTRRITGLLEQPELPRPERALQPQGTEIVFDRVSFAYDDKREALKEVSFTVREGTFTALVGPSGAGKTTIARLLPRFWDAAEGSVSIGGVDVREMDGEALMGMISYVFQDVYLFQGTIMDNIRMGRPDATDEEVVEAARQARCHDFIAALPDGYRTVVGEGGGKLSGGQRQRISIVRAFLKQAPILVLDEATALIDPENEARIQDALNELVNPTDGKPKTVLMIAHRLHTVVHADQIVVVEDGRVAACGTHEQLLASYEGYRKQWEAYTQLPEDDSVFAAGLAASGETAAVPSPSADSRPPAGAQADADRKDDEPAEDLYPQLGSLPLLQKSFVLTEGEQDRKRLRQAYWRTLLESPFISLAPIFVALAVAGMSTGNTDDAWLYAGAMGLGFLIQGLLYYHSNKVLFPFYPKLSSNVRLYLGKRLKNLPLGFFVGRETATLEMRIKQDAMMTGFLPTLVTMLIKGTIAPLVTLAALLWIDWPLALIAAAGIPLSLLVTLLADRRFHGVMNRLQEARDNANGRIVDFIRGISVVRAFGLARSSLIGYKDTMDEYRRSSIAINNRLSPYSALNGIVFELGFVAVIVAGGFRYTNGSLDGLSFICFMMLAAVLYEPLPMIDYMAGRRMMHATVRNLNEIVLEDDLPQPKAGEERLPQGHEIELRGVRFGYDGSRPVLKGVDLKIPAKGVTALVGPSGGGKTTTLNLIARLWDAAEGSVTVGGVDVREMRHDTLMSRVSFVFQDVYLFPDSILANIKYGNPEATTEQVVAAAKAARCHDFIMELPDGYDTLVSEGGGTLSGGQRQRISIARAILKDAPIVLLDEATASVDPENERHIREALQALAADKTVVMVAHRLNTIRQADLIAVMQDGQVIQTGKHEELLAENGLYRTFWEERSRAERWQIQH